MAAKLTQLQSEFLKILFGPLAQGNLTVAANELGITDYEALLTPELTSAIKSRADHEITLNVPRAIFVMRNMLDNPNNSINMEKVTKLCTEFLDRAGLGKVERMSEGGLKIGLVILPNKFEIKEPVDHETIEASTQEIQELSNLHPEVSLPAPLPATA